MKLRPYDAKKDQEAVQRIWYEIGWMSESDQKKLIDKFVDGSRGLVIELDGEAECLALSAPGIFRYQSEDLSLSAVTTVATSRVARKQGYASYLTANLIAAEAADGALVSALGIFEQGFYNRLGYGSGPYENWISFDPAQLNIKNIPRLPRRLTIDDAEQIHQAMLNRLRGHGACSLLLPGIVEAEIGWSSKGFGLGYADEQTGTLTHFLWATDRGENGPYTITFMAYQNGEQFLELLAIIKSWGDQVRMVRMHEPQGIQMQDFLVQPFRYRQLTKDTKYANTNHATAYWQLRICDLSGCLAHTHLPGKPIRFNLSLTDPIADLLDGDASWQGIGGDYVVTLGPESEAVPGKDAALPTLTASVGAFSRLWMGALPATGLAVSAPLNGPPELLNSLDQLLRLPLPKWGWDF
jgi:hypothetical protein